MKKRLLSIIAMSLAVQSQGQDMCPIVERKESGTRLDSDDPNGPDFREVSGLAFSPKQKHDGNPIFYAISDGGGGARIGMFDSDSGERLLTLKLDRSYFENKDWESLTIGSCGKTGVDDTCLYIMDAGDNEARLTSGKDGRNTYHILKIKEPKLNDYDDNDTIPKSRMSRLDFDYRHSSSPTNHADCEAMFIDHTGWGNDEEIGDIYLATKWDRGNEKTKNRLFRVPASAWSGSYNGSSRDYSPRTIGSYNYGDYQDNGGTHIMRTTWSSGEMSFDGTLIGLANLSRSYVFLRCPGTSVRNALANPNARSKPCVDWSHPSTGQVETFAWTPDKRYTLDIPEGNVPRMGWTKLKYDRGSSSKVCEVSSPTDRPTDSPPTDPPTRSPTDPPTRRPPTDPPTRRPSTDRPTDSPTESPSTRPSISHQPSVAPSLSPCNGHIFKLVMQTDYVGSEISWSLSDRDQEVAAGSGYSNNARIEETRCVDGGIHTFAIWDSFGDGICCQYGPGWYQIWYDGVIIHDSDGQYGSEETISFAAAGLMESAESSMAPSATSFPTESPSAAPTTDTSGANQTESPVQSRPEDSLYGIYCRGICPAGSLIDSSSIAQFSDGPGFLCSQLDEQYKQLFSTPSACNQLSVSAQDAGCICTDPAPSLLTLEESPHEELPGSNAKFGTSQWLYVGSAVLGVICIACLARRAIASKASKASKGQTEEEEMEDNEPGPTGSNTKPRSKKPGSDLAGLLPKQRESAEPKGRMYLQSWVLWAAASEKDNQTVDETIFEDGPLAI